MTKQELTIKAKHFLIDFIKFISKMLLINSVFILALFATQKDFLHYIFNFDLLDPIYLSIVTIFLWLLMLELLLKITFSILAAIFTKHFNFLKDTPKYSIGIIFVNCTITFIRLSLDHEWNLLYYLDQESLDTIYNTYSATNCITFKSLLIVALLFFIASLPTKIRRYTIRKKQRIPIYLKENLAFLCKQKNIGYHTLKVDLLIPHIHDLLDNRYHDDTIHSLIKLSNYFKISLNQLIKLPILEENISLKQNKPSNEDKIYLFRNMRHSRMNHSIDLDTLSDDLEIDYKQLLDLENGILCSHSLEHLCMIADYFNLTLDELILDPSPHDSYIVSVSGDVFHGIDKTFVTKISKWMALMIILTISIAMITLLFHIKNGSYIDHAARNISNTLFSILITTVISFISKSYDDELTSITLLNTASERKHIVKTICSKRAGFLLSVLMVPFQFLLIRFLLLTMDEGDLLEIYEPVLPWSYILLVILISIESLILISNRKKYTSKEENDPSLDGIKQLGIKSRKYLTSVLNKEKLIHGIKNIAINITLVYMPLLSYVQINHLILPGYLHPSLILYSLLLSVVQLLVTVSLSAITYLHSNKFA